MKVSAKDKATGKEQAISIKASGGLDDSEIEQMVQDAETYAEQDKERREKVEARNQSEVCHEHRNLLMIWVTRQTQL